MFSLPQLCAIHPEMLFFLLFFINQTADDLLVVLGQGIILRSLQSNCLSTNVTTQLWVYIYFFIAFYFTSTHNSSHLCR